MPAGPETRRWADGKCMIYDTTFEHETFNESTDQETVLLVITLDHRRPKTCNGGMGAKGRVVVSSKREQGEVVCANGDRSRENIE